MYQRRPTYQLTRQLVDDAQLTFVGAGARNEYGEWDYDKDQNLPIDVKCYVEPYPHSRRDELPEGVRVDDYRLMITRHGVVKDVQIAHVIQYGPTRYKAIALEVWPFHDTLTLEQLDE